MPKVISETYLISNFKKITSSFPLFQRGIKGDLSVTFTPKKLQNIIETCIKGAIVLLLAALAAIGAMAEEASAENCADCHSDSTAFKEWQGSGHANSLETLFSAPDTNWTCLRCHSSDYKRIREIVRDTRWESVDDMPTVRSASNPVSCSACHRHDSGMETNLVESADRLCTSCHVFLCGG